MVSLLAILTTMLLALRNLSATVSLREQVQLLDLTHDAIVVYGLDEIITFWSRGAHELYGWSAQEAIGKPFHQLVQTTFPEERGAIRDQLRGTDRWEGELQQVRRDGSAVTVSSRWSLWRDQGGRPLAILATNNDITQAKRMAAEILAQQRELRATIDAIPAMVWSSSTDGQLMFANQRWSEMGLSFDDGQADIWRTIVHPDDHARMERDWKQALATGRLYENVSRVRRGDGVYRWLQLRAAPLKDADGKVQRWYGINTDVEERKRAEEALARSEAFLTEAQGLSRTGSISLKVRTREMTWSPEAYRIFGYELSAQPSIDLVLQRVHSDDLARVQTSFDQAMRGSPYIDIEHRLSMPDGSVRHLHVVAHPVAQTGEPEYAGALMDVTAARQTQEALHRSMTELAHVTRVTTLGELAASIAHEVSQPISGIVTNGDAGLRWLRRATPDLGEVAAALENIIRDARRSSEIIQRIRALAQKRDPHYAVINPNSIVEESIDLVQRELLNHRAELHVDLLSDPPSIRGDRVQLQQVIINLMVNGMQAMSQVTDRQRELTVRTLQPDAEHVLILVQDSGSGISAEDEERLFNTFFTTKADGMGMGLSICRSIIEAHGGRIWATRHADFGATLQFMLPVAHAEAEQTD